MGAVSCSLFLVYITSSFLYKPNIHFKTCVSCALSFFWKVGTIPLDIIDFAEAMEEGENLTNYIEETLRAANSDLLRFAHKPILVALKTSLDGVSTDDFQGVNHGGVNLAEPKEVGVAMKMRNAIVFHQPSGKYRLASRAHRTALIERYNPMK